MSVLVKNIVLVFFFMVCVVAHTHVYAQPPDPCPCDPFDPNYAQCINSNPGCADPDASIPINTGVVWLMAAGFALVGYVYYKTGNIQLKM